jgi:hypothetical protein
MHLIRSSDNYELILGWQRALKNSSLQFGHLELTDFEIQLSQKCYPQLKLEH